MHWHSYSYAFFSVYGLFQLGYPRGQRKVLSKPSHFPLFFGVALSCLETHVPYFLSQEKWKILSDQIAYAFLFNFSVK